RVGVATGPVSSCRISSLVSSGTAHLLSAAESGSLDVAPQCLPGGDPDLPGTIFDHASVDFKSMRPRSAAPESLRVPWYGPAIASMLHRRLARTVRRILPCG